MEEWPDIKHPIEFTGKGFEIIGDPSRPLDTGTLNFNDGKFAGLELPSRETLPQWTSAIADKWSDLIQSQKWERKVDDLAIRLRDDPKNTEAKSERKEMLNRCVSDSEKRALRRALKSIKDGYAARDWPAQNPRERAAIIALMETSTELCRPPTVPEVTDRMHRIRDSLVDMKPKLTCSSRQQLAKVLDDLGFHWLERAPVGRPNDSGNGQFLA